MKFLKIIVCGTSAEIKLFIEKFLFNLPKAYIY